MPQNDPNRKYISNFYMAEIVHKADTAEWRYIFINVISVVKRDPIVWL